MKKKSICRVRLEPSGKIISAPAHSNLARVIQQAGFPLSTWCRFRGLCGRCVVEIIEGDQPPLQEKEIFFQKKRQWPRSFRLACLFPLQGDVVLRLPETSLIRGVSILEKGIPFQAELDPAIKKYHLRLKPPSLAQPFSLLSRWQKALANPRLKISLKNLTQLASLEAEKNIITAYVYDEEEIVKVEKFRPSSPAVGLAVDLGTTTLVVEAVDLETGQTLGRELSLNHQVRFGADIVTRLSYAMEKKENLKELQQTILADLNQMITNLLSRIKLSPANILEVVLAGNAAMNHLLLGLPVESLAMAPFAALFSHLLPLSGRQVGLKIHPEGKVYLAPNIFSFIGGDISAGLLAAGFLEDAGPFAFIDLGTNGEIAVKAKKRFVVSSTAAGPAFEGMNLTCGMIASSGAICRAEWSKDKLIIHTIGQEAPRGICGSGLIDLLAISLRHGQMEASGRLKGGKNQLIVAPGIVLTQADIRQAQLACAAVKTGFRLLLDYLRLRPEDLKAVYMAGAFGQELSIKNSMSLGLLPRLETNKVYFLGNTSLAGARLLLLNRSSRERLLSSLKKIEYISLASQEKFETYFLEAMRFGPWP